jgi:hypothetical protein
MVTAMSPEESAKKRARTISFPTSLKRPTSPLNSARAGIESFKRYEKLMQ